MKHQISQTIPAETAGFGRRDAIPAIITLSRRSSHSSGVKFDLSGMGLWPERLEIWPASVTHPRGTGRRRQVLIAARCNAECVARSSRRERLCFRPPSCWNGHTRALGGPDTTGAAPPRVRALSREGRPGWIGRPADPMEAARRLMLARNSGGNDLAWRFSRLLQGFNRQTGQKRSRDRGAAPSGRKLPQWRQLADCRRVY
jgi:hypothetical protein